MCIKNESTGIRDRVKTWIFMSVFRFLFLPFGKMITHANQQLAFHSIQQVPNPEHRFTLFSSNVLPRRSHNPSSVGPYQTRPILSQRFYCLCVHSTLKAKFNCKRVISIIAGAQVLKINYYFVSVVFHLLGFLSIFWMQIEFKK